MNILIAYASKYGCTIVSNIIESNIKEFAANLKG